MRKQNIQNLKTNHYDLIVVGGGIHGATLLSAAAKRGLKACLVEKNDFGAATSANSLKIIHGGFRYLQHGNIKRMRESILARKFFIESVPHLIRPLPCVLPTVKSGLKSKMLMRIALKINDIVGFDRNKNIPKESRLPGGRIIDKSKFRELFPLVDPNGFTGGAMWHDSFSTDTERTSLEFILNAIDSGAHASNYLEVKRILKDNNSVSGVVALDEISGEQFEIKGDHVVLAIGPWLNDFLVNQGKLKSQHEIWCYGLNLVLLKKLLTDTALGLEGIKEYKDVDAIIKQGKRMFFFVPWRGYTMVGTGYKLYRGKPDDFKITTQQIQQFLDEVNEIYPNAKLKYKDVSFYQAGILPIKSLPGNEYDDVQLQKESEIIFHEESDRIKGLISILSIKYTTAPIIAESVLNKINSARSEIKKAEPASQDFDLIKDLPYFDEYRKRYGDRVFLLAEEYKNLAGPVEIIQEDPLISNFEISYLIKRELIEHLDDVVLRRTGLGTAEKPSDDVLKKIVDILSKKIGWDENQINSEIEKLKEQYSPLIS